MLKQIRIFAVSAALACSPLVMAEQSVEQVIGNYLDARGGLEKLTAINTARLTGNMSMGGGHGGHGGAMNVPIVAEYQPAKQRIRFEFEVQGKTGVQAYDGETGWALQPFMGKTEPERLAEDQLNKVRQQADLLGALVNYREKGHQVELQGIEDVEGTEAYKLKVTKSNDDVAYYYLDTEYFLAFRVVSSTIIQGRKVKTVTTIGDYKDIDGILFAHSIAVTFPGGAQTMTYDKIELDVDIADDRFTMPVDETLKSAG